MKCLNSKCNATEIEEDDNFCYKCGYYTSKGYKFLKDENNIKMITSGNVAKQNNKISTLGYVFVLSIIIFTAMTLIRGNDLLKPLSYIRKKGFNYIYGYKTSLIKNNNQYTNKYIYTTEEAIEYVKKDFSTQEWQCYNDYKVERIANDLENKYEIPSITFCDISLNQSTNIKQVIEKMYALFPNLKGGLTNITITNAETKEQYIALFQPKYQFVNSNNDIASFNKVNKTQILLNSYYFLNDNVLEEPIEETVGKDWYVKDATWSSSIAHELGHYISFYILLKENSLENIILETKDNEETIKKVVDEYEQGTYSKNIIEQAKEKYNTKNNSNLSLKEFTSTISKYASVEDENNNIIADETIAEAIHDYYLHGENMKPASKEIIDIILSKM